MEYLSPSSPTNWTKFGIQLAQLHRQTSVQFGFAGWNYIGSLRQENNWEDTAAAFFINQRLQPQFTLANQQGFYFPKAEQLYSIIEQIIPAEAPALIHGDLWNGNYLSTDRGFALIDPAISFGIREMDLAMMHLFGGFPTEVFMAYEEVFPTEKGLASRLPLYQLYYVLVHVNLFGQAYYQQAKSIIARYV